MTLFSHSTLQCAAKYIDIAICGINRVHTKKVFGKQVLWRIKFKACMVLTVQYIVGSSCKIIKVLVIDMNHQKDLQLYTSLYNLQFSPLETSLQHSIATVYTAWLNCIYEHKLLQITVCEIIVLWVQLADKLAISHGELSEKVPVLVNKQSKQQWGELIYTPCTQHNIM